MLDSIRINNFKSIKEGSAKFPSFGAIVGHNAAGKTNLIQAIDFIRFLSCGGSTTQFQRQISLTPEELFNHNVANPEFSIECNFSIEEEKFKLFVATALMNGGSRPKELVIVKEKLEHIAESAINTLYQREGNNLYGQSDAVIPVALDPKKLALPLFNDQKSSVLIKDYFANLTVVPSELGRLRDSIGNTAGDSLSNLLIRFSHSQPDLYQQFQTIVRKMLPAFSSIVEIAGPKNDAAPQEEQFLAVLEEKNLKGKLSMQSVSSGDLKTLFLIALSVSMKKGSTLLIEEIENATHPHRVKDLVSRLRKIAMVNDLQILFSTHSPIVINSLTPNEILFAKKNIATGTKYTLVSEAKEAANISDFLDEGGETSEFLQKL